MEMSEKEYEELIGHFEFLEDKVEGCYKRETQNVLENLKRTYEKCIVKYGALNQNRMAQGAEAEENIQENQNNCRKRKTR